jgi:hypothetical protein
MPDLIDPISGKMPDDEILKSMFSHWFDCTSAPSGPIKETSTDDSSKLVLLKLDDGDIDQQYTKVVPSSLIEDKMQRKLRFQLKVTRILKTMSQNGRSLLQLSYGRSKRTQTASCQ